ncbi:PREDICTED: F-box protein At5g07610-like [Fragaria vesca subsp. vesca]|uniref:F-box protein At5g07610-like n=1 Tax=Fragaria vesca subsp. vesca TaxID=101020 RepID=UPI0002C305E3|nr:PREDICTED: F-box protein At5g07610-like [Fragaria vesca subsp. vesca]
MEQILCLERCSGSTLGETVANIEELLTEILVRVPARPLVRFKCVSKRWLSLISDPKFCHRHTLRNPHPSISAIFTNVSTDFYHITLDHLEQCDTSTNPGNKRIPASAARNPLNFVPHLYGTYIVQSCNGLFLCLPDPPIGSPPIINHPYYVLNPTTNQFSALVPPAAAAATTHQPRIFGYALAFDPSKSPHYKVVFLWSVNEPVDGYCRFFHIEIYSSETQSWRLHDSSFIRKPNVDYRKGYTAMAQFIG